MEAETPHVAGAVQHAYDDGLGLGYAEVDVAVAVHGEPKAGVDVVAGNTRMAELGNFFQVGIELKNEPISGARIVPSNASANGPRVPLGRRGDDQPFCGDGSSPDRVMSARNSSALVYTV